MKRDQRSKSTLIGGIHMPFQFLIPQSVFPFCKNLYLFISVLNFKKGKEILFLLFYCLCLPGKDKNYANLSKVPEWGGLWLPKRCGVR